jgi:Putative auto-transporter adhesin, head GIN domain
MRNVFMLLLIASFIGACNQKSGSGNIVSETKSVGNFTRLSSSHGFEVNVKKGDSYQVVIEADDNLMQYVSVKVKNGELHIGMEDNLSLSNASLKASVTTPVLEGASTSSASEIFSSEVWKSNSTWNLNASSGSTINLRVDAPSVKAESSSGSKITVSGRTQTANFEASSGSGIRAFDLLSERVIAGASSGAHIDLHSSVQLDGEASSGAGITYRGNPTVKKNESSGGRVSAQ